MTPNEYTFRYPRRNWPDYNRALIARGRLTFWFDEEAVVAWRNTDPQSGHPSIATTLNNLAVLYEAQGRYEEAEPLHLRSLKLREEALGEDHPEVATTLNNLAGLYLTQRRYAEAEPLYIRSLRTANRRRERITPWSPQCSAAWASCTGPKDATRKRSHTISAV